MITRTYDFEIRTENDEKHGDHLTGRPIVFGKATDLAFFDETIDAGALDATDLRDVRFLINHNTDMVPLARSRRNNESSTMQMEVDSEGMAIRVDLDTENNSEARNLYSAVKRGDISGMSFMFEVNGESWEDLDSDHPTRHITDIRKVYEVSAVTFPAYEDTSITARDDKDALDSARAALDREKRKEDVRQRLNTMLGEKTDE